MDRWICHTILFDSAVISSSMRCWDAVFSGIEFPSMLVRERAMLHLAGVWDEQGKVR